MTTALGALFNTFPRQMAIPGRFLVTNLNDMLRVIREYNGRRPVFTSLYHLVEIGERRKHDVFTNRLDKVFLDFDGLDKRQQATELAEDLSRDRVKNGVAMSGGGYHIHIAARPHALKNPDGALWHYLNDLSEEYGVPIDVKTGIDPVVHGDVTRCVRIPGTFNVKRGVPSGFIPWAHLHSEPDVLVKNLNLDDWMSPGEPLDLRPWDKERPFVSADSLDIEGASADVVPEVNCVREFMKDGDANNQKRYVMATHVVELGHTLPDLYRFMQSHLSVDKWEHCIGDEGDPFKRIYDDAKAFPGCDWIRKQTGFPMSACKGCPKYYEVTK